MSIIINDNFSVNVGKPVDSKYLNITTPWQNTFMAQASIPVSYRYQGLTILVRTGTTNVEYWWKDGVQNNQLIVKRAAPSIDINDYVSGATNLGYFSGMTGIQTLIPSGFGPNTSFNGQPLHSTYISYYTENSFVRIGSPANTGEFRRAYISSDKTKSWIYDANASAWRFVSGDVSAMVGQQVVLISYDGPNYTQLVFTGNTNTGYNYMTVNNNLTDGVSHTIGYPIYKDKTYQRLNFKTLMSTDSIKISSDDNYIYFSGASNQNGQVIGINGLTSTTGGTIALGGTLTGTTKIIDSRVTPRGIEYDADYSSTYSARSLVDAAYVTGQTSGGALIRNTYTHPNQSEYFPTVDDYYIGVSGATIVNLNNSNIRTNGRVLVISDIGGGLIPNSCYIQVTGTFVGGGTNSCISSPFTSMTYIYNGMINKWDIIGFAPTPTP